MAATSPHRPRSTLEWAYSPEHSSVTSSSRYSSMQSTIKRFPYVRRAGFLCHLTHKDFWKYLVSNVNWWDHAKKHLEGILMTLAAVVICWKHAFTIIHTSPYNQPCHYLNHNAVHQYNQVNKIKNWTFIIYWRSIPEICCFYCNLRLID